MEFSGQFDLHALLDTVNVSLSRYTVVFSMTGACTGTQTWTDQIIGGGTNNPGIGADMKLNTPNCQINPGATLNWTLRMSALALTQLPASNTACATRSWTRPTRYRWMASVF